MKATIVNENEKRMTAMLVIKYEIDGCKRSQTRHCQQAAGGKWRGFILDTHRRELEALKLASETLQREISAMHRELGIQERTAASYTPDLLFAWIVGQDNEIDYQAHVTKERRIAHQRIARLNSDIDKLRAQIEAHRAAERNRCQKVA